MKHQLTIFADYFQFYIEDDGRSFEEVDKLWDEQSLADRFAIRPGSIAIATVRNMPVSVAIEIIEGHMPAIKNEEWDHISECNLEVSSGKIVILGTTDYYPTAVRIEVVPGNYRAVIYYAGLNTLSEDGLDGNDRYEIVLNQSQEITPRVIKRF